MKITGWLVAVAAVVLSAQCAMAGSATSDIIAGDVSTTAGQAAIVAGIAATVGDAAAVQTQLVTSSGGTLLKAMAAANGNTAITDVNDVLLGAATTGSGNTGALSILSGTNATSASNAGAATAGAIGGGGGVISGRQSGLMAERKAMGNIDSALASYKMNQNFANRLWASPFYTSQNMDQKDGYDGYDYSAWGVSLGYDRFFGPIAVGAAFTYSRGDFDADNINDDNTIDNYGFSLYGQYYSCTGFFATLTGGYNYGDNDMKATLAPNQVFTSTNHTDSWWLGGNIGKDFVVSENWTVTPTIGLFYSKSTGSAYTEVYNNVGYRRFGEIKNSALLMPIDVKVEYTAQLDECSSVSFNVAGGYAYNFRGDSGRSEGSFQYVNVANSTVMVQGVEGGRNSWNLGAGVTYRRNNFDVGLSYRYDGKSKFDGHRIAATVGWNF